MKTIPMTEWSFFRIVYSVLTITATILTGYGISQMGLSFNLGMPMFGTSLMIVSSLYFWGFHLPKIPIRFYRPEDDST